RLKPRGHAFTSTLELPYSSNLLTMAQRTVTGMSLTDLKAMGLRAFGPPASELDTLFDVIVQRGLLDFGINAISTRSLTEARNLIASLDPRALSN
ncbi:MAG: hypothetical protein Q9204_002241, partial [Flavoplaca sp. TL-2023a]